MTTLVDLERIIESSVSDEIDQAMETATAYAVVSMFESKAITQDQLDYILLDFENIVSEVFEEAQEPWQNIIDMREEIEDDMFDFDAIDYLVQLELSFLNVVANKKVLEYLAPAYSDSVNMKLVERLMDDDSITAYRIAKELKENELADLSEAQVQNIKKEVTQLENVKFPNLKALEKVALKFYE